VHSEAISLPFGEGQLFAADLALLDAQRVDAVTVSRETERERRRSRDSISRRTLIYADLLAASLAIMFTVLLAGVDVAWPDFLAVALMAPVARSLGLYDLDADRLAKSTLDEVPRIVGVATIITVLTLVVRDAFLISENSIGTLHLAYLTTILTSAMCAGRLAARKFVVAKLPAERILVVGDQLDRERLAHALAAVPGLNSTIVAHVTPSGEETDNSLPPEMAHPDNLANTLGALNIDRVVIGTHRLSASDIARLVRGISDAGARTSLQPRLFGSLPLVPSIEGLGAVKLLNLRQPRLSVTQQRLKRALDLAWSTILTVLTLPLIAATAIAIKIDSPGPVFYRQRRIGKNGDSFEIIKFRTMHLNANDQKREMQHLNETSGLFKVANDPRITRVGGLLRKTSIDELPQLFNVIRGEMSLVGPRPLVPEEDCTITGWGRNRSSITPGMTGAWQLLGPVRIPMDEMVELDNEYVTNWSLTTDVKIMLRTVPHVLWRRGL
jgi:exopolysaccharide biosynthesis polyprenyl glycosylphosphotransferase